MGSSNTVISSLEEGKERLKKFAANYDRMSFAFVSEHGGTLTLHERWQQPCYGEMRPYSNRNPDLLPEDQRSVSKPGDLHSPFPTAGNPVLLALAFPVKAKGVNEKDRPYMQTFCDLFLDKGSPWQECHRDVEVIYDGETPTGILYNDTDIPPTPLVQGWMMTRYRTDFKSLHDLREQFPEATAAQLLLFWLGSQRAGSNRHYIGVDPYLLDPRFEVSWFLEGRPIIVGPSFRDRGAYNRPGLHRVFGKDSPQPFFRSFSDHLAKLKIFHSVDKVFSEDKLPEVFKEFLLFTEAFAADH